MTAEQNDERRAEQGAVAGSARPDAPRPRGLARAGLVLANVLIVVLLYSNIAILGNLVLHRLHLPISLPMLRYTDNLFSLHALFSEYLPPYHDLNIYGMTPPTPSAPQGRAMLLERDEFFPYWPAEVMLRAQISKQGSKGPEARKQALKQQAQKIRVRHNRLHPSTPVERIIIARTDWPRSPVPVEMLIRDGKLEVVYRDE